MWFWFSNPFFWIGYTFFWFWVLVKCKKWFIYFVFDFGFLYTFFILAIPPFLFDPLFFFIFGIPHFFGLTDQFILFLFVIHSLLLLLLLLTASSRPRYSIDRRLFVPAKKCVRIKKLCKTHYKCYYYYDCMYDV